MHEPVCPGCGEANPESARLCGMCRTVLVADDAADDGGRLVTVVTSDLKGSTALGEQLDPESLREVLNRYFAVMRVVFESHGGSIEKIIGDAIVAVFGLPFRHEDDPVRAVEAAAESQRALATLNDELDTLWGVRLVNRTGIASGIVHFGRDAEGQHVLIGETMDESTAMEQNAPAVEILMAESTYREVRDLVEATDMGLKSPKGSDLQIQSYQLISVASRATEEDTTPPEPSLGMRACQVCGDESPDRYRYCVSCGASATTVVARDSRKTVTIVFANPRLHTDSGVPLDPKAFTDIMTRYFEVMKAALERHGGTVEKFIGDAVMAVFGLPVRHEDDALRAVRAAADMQAALPRLNEAFGERHGVRLLNHIGVNTGEVIASGDSSTGQRLVTGDAVNTAARLEQAAGAAEIILGELTHRLTRDHVEVEVIPPLVLKGKAEPVPAYRFVSVRERPVDRGVLATRFVGREAEVARLAEALFAAAGDKRARLINVVGDAGVGKSRLIREFAISAAHEASLVRGRCLPYGDGITFWPLSDVVRDAAAIASDDNAEAAIEKIHGLLGDPGWAGERGAVTDRIASMMNLSPTQFPVAELMWGMRRLLEALAAERPLVMIIDDIHSAERTFLDFIDYLVETAEYAPILILCSARHELVERHAEWAEAHADDMITLVPLSDGEVGQLVGELLGDLDPSVRERIATAAEGNPLYTEQIVSMLQETGAIRRDGERWISTRAAAALAIPPTIQALVAARLDALGADERAVIEPASVIGLSFAEEAIAELVGDATPGRVEIDLGSLAAKQLIRRTTSEDASYRFGHLVIKETAYGSLLKRVRVALHERFVVWAERTNRERGRETEFEEILGYHLEQAYRYRTELGPLDDEGRAVAWRAATKLSSAGRRALTRGDMPAAANLLRRAAGLLPFDDPVRIELLPELAEALYFGAGRSDDAKATLDEARRTSESIGDDRLVARAEVGILLIERFSGSAADEPPLDRALQAKRVLESHGDESGIAQAWRLITGIHTTAGHYEAAASAAEQAILHAEAAGDERLVLRGVALYASMSALGPTPVTEAIERCERMAARARGDRRTEAIVAGSLAPLYAMKGSFDHARALYQRERALLVDLGPSIMASSTAIDGARVELLAGDLAAAEGELRRDYGELESLNESYYRSTIAGLLARVLFLQGDLSGADEFCRIARDLADDDDIEAQVLARSVQARLLAAAHNDGALGIAEQVVELSAGTADLELRGNALMDLAEALLALGMGEAAGPPLREALRLFEQKGDDVSGGRVQRLLDSLRS